MITSAKLTFKKIYTPIKVITIIFRPEQKAEVNQRVIEINARLPSNFQRNIHDFQFILKLKGQKM